MNLSKPLRSVLFVPGNRPHMLDKARALPADAVILDLEDAVPPGEKAMARSTVRQALKGAHYGPRAILRINSFGTGLAETDLREAFVTGVDAVCLPKADTASDVEQLGSLLANLEQERDLPVGAVGILLMVETARGVLNAYGMAKAGQAHGGRRVQALCLGGEDLAWDLGAVRSREGTEIAYARAHLVFAARAAGAVAIDTVYTDLGDQEGMLAEARQARRLGYGGKLLIHPAQIEPAHEAFAPSEEEVAHAQRVLDAFEAAGARGEGVIALDGQMIDAPVVARAREVLTMADLRQRKD